VLGDRSAEEHDALVQQARVDVEGALAARGLLDDHGNQWAHVTFHDSGFCLGAKSGNSVGRTNSGFCLGAKSGNSVGSGGVITSAAILAMGFLPLRGLFLLGSGDFVAQERRSASPRATFLAQAMIVSIGLTPSEVGSTDASAMCKPG